MAITTKFTVKRSGVTGTPSNLASGELAYSYLPADSNNGGDRLYIGTGTNNDSGYAANIDIIGGKYYTDLLGGDSDIRGTLTPNSAILVDANSKIDQLKIDSIIIDSSAINTISGNLKLSPGVDGKVVVTSDIIPSRNGLSLGDSTSPFGDLWLGGSTLYIGNLKLSDSGGALVVTNRRTGDDAKLDLGSTTTDSIDEGLINLYYTTDRVNTDVTALVDSAYVQSRQAGINNLLDSADVIGIIDSAHVQARQAPQDFAYASLTGKPNILDSSDVLGLVTANSTDSATVIGIVDSAYVQSRQTPQDFSYTSLIDVPDFFDSADAQILIDSAYIQARQTPQDFSYASLTGTPTSVSEFANDLNYLDSTTAIPVARNAVSATSSGDGSLTYDASSGVFTYVGPGAGDVRAYIQAGTGVTYDTNTGTISIGQDVGTNDNVTFNNITVQGNLQVDGTTTTVNTTSLEVSDNMIYLNAGESSGSPTQFVDVGWAANVNDTGSYEHVGFFRDATDGKFKLFEGYTPEPDASAQIDLSHSSFSLAPLEVLTIAGKYLGFDSDFAAKSTTDLAEGNNLYYTTARHDSDTLVQVDSSYVQARQDYSYTSLIDVPDFFDSSDAVILIDSAYVQARSPAAVPQDFSWSSLTGVPDFVDSADVQEIIDSAYVAARSAPTLTVNQVDSADGVEVTVGNISTINFDNYTGFNVTDQGSGAVKVSLGSGFKTIQVDGQDDIIAVGEDTLEVEAGNGINITTNIASNPKALNISADSSFVTNIVDSSYVQLRSPTYVGFDSDFGTKTTDDLTEGSTNLYYTTARHDSDTRLLVDSAYVQVRQTPQDFSYTSLTNVPDFFDSADAILLIDSAYIQARQIDIFRDSGFISSIIDSAYIQLRDRVRDSAFVTSIIDSAYISLRDRLRDSTFVENIIDSAYIQARQTTFDFLDSAEAIALIDSAYVQARQTPQDFSWASLTGVPDFVDSSDVQNIIDSAYIQARQADIFRDSAFVTDLIDSGYITNIVDSAYVALVLDSGLSISGNLTVGGVLNAGSLNLTNTGSTTFRSDNELILAATDRVLIDSSVFRIATMTDAQISSVSLPENGDMVYNSTTNKFQGYENGAWVNLVLDSSSVVNIIDSAYIQARQADIFRDSGFVTGIIDSAYINARVSFDSGVVTSLVDSAYIQLRDRFQDSSGILAIVDSAYVQARQEAGTDSSAVIGLITTTVDSNYVNSLTNRVGASTVIAPFAFARVATTSNGSGNGISWSNWNAGNGSLDFTFSSAQPDTNYVVVTDAETFDDYHVGISSKTVNGFTAEFYDTSGTRQPSGYSPFTFLIYGSTPTRSVGGGVAAEIDSADVINLIDSAYIQARVEAGTDSATVSSIIEATVDSNYVQARVPTLGDLGNAITSGKQTGSALIYNGNNWIIDQNPFISMDCGTATFVDEGIIDDGGGANDVYSTSDRVDCGSAYAA